MTSKHRKREKKITNDSEDVKINNKLCENNFVCNCDNTYKYRQGLHKHKKTCDVDKTKSFPIISAKDQSSRMLFVYENSFKEIAISFYNKCQPKIQIQI